MSTADELRAELAEVEHLCRTLDPRARAYVGRLLADHDDLAREVELRGQDIAQWQLACARHQREHFDAKAEAERLRGERDAARREASEAALDAGWIWDDDGELIETPEAYAKHRGWDCYPSETGAPEGAAAFVGTWPGDESEAELLAAERVAGGTDGAPEGEQPRHDGECRVKLGPSRDGWVCSKGTLGCIGEQP